MKDLGKDYPYSCLGIGHSCGSKLMGEEEEEGKKEKKKEEEDEEEKKEEEEKEEEEEEEMTEWDRESFYLFLTHNKL